MDGEYGRRRSERPFGRRAVHLESADLDAHDLTRDNEQTTEVLDLDGVARDVACEEEGEAGRLVRGVRRRSVRVFCRDAGRNS